MISLITVLGITTFFNCSDILHLNEYPVGNVASDYKDKLVCRVALNSRNYYVTSTINGSCTKIIKLCNIKVKK